MDMGQVNQQLPVRVASPQLVAANHILSLSSDELQAAIQRELDENPALEKEDVSICLNCGRPLQNGGFCASCAAQSTATTVTTPDGDASGDYAGDEQALWSRRTAGGAISDDDEFDPTTRVAAQISLAEHLTLSLQAQYGPEDAPIIEYLVGNLDDNGRLRCDVDEVVDLFDVPEARVETILRSLQAMEPLGVGARDLPECLLIQLSYLESQGVTQPFAREVITGHLMQLGEHKYTQIASALNTTADAIHAVSEFMRRNLNPYPARGYLGANLIAGGERTTAVLPDVIISKRMLFDASASSCIYEVEVVESKRFFLNLNPSYAQLYADVSSHHSSLSESDRRHIQQYVSRAKLFISNINQRRQTLYKITKHIVELQRAFLDYGIRAQRPLTRARVALDLGMHESTVSRATAAKYCMLPSGEVIPFSHFFVANLGVKDLIKDLIDGEQEPMTDQELADLLRARGIPVARRTVAKYREQLSILPSTLR
jgi:RNA polymerase sigma-54 factor